MGESNSKSKILTQIITGKSVVIKTTTRQTYFLPVAGLVEPEKLKPGDLVGVKQIQEGYNLQYRKTNAVKIENMLAIQVKILYA